MPGPHRGDRRADLRCILKYYMEYYNAVRTHLSLGKDAVGTTGLGLSISHDIIVKQHAGAIEVDTQLGEFTEIRVILPRSAVFV